jgi:protocatechuate 3,4-dioxygenase beta subunit
MKRRTFLKSSLALTGIGLAGCDTLKEMAKNGDSEVVLNLTPACGDDDDFTPAQTEGPFYTPNVPERTSLIEEGMAGTVLVLTGKVLLNDCQPVAGAIVDFWHCDPDGVYDNEGFRFRGKQYTDENGNYRLETLLPGVYPGRTRHIHVKTQRPGGELLTTQLYFPNEPQNEQDGIFMPELLVGMTDAEDGSKAATFDFVL